MFLTTHLRHTKKHRAFSRNVEEQQEITGYLAASFRAIITDSPPTLWVTTPIHANSRSGAYGCGTRRFLANKKVATG